MSVAHHEMNVALSASPLRLSGAAPASATTDINKAIQLHCCDSELQNQGHSFQGQNHKNWV